MSKPNILIFMTDQQRGDSAPPSSRARMPRLEEFCRQGLAFSQAFTVAPHCCPSRASFFSGLYPSQHGVWNNVDVGNTLSKGLHEGVTLFSEDLQRAGYSLYFSGKWHVSAVETPLDRGFDAMGYPGPRTTQTPGHTRPHTREWAAYEGLTEPGERETARILRSGYPPYTHYGQGERSDFDRLTVDDAVEKLLSRTKDDGPWCQFVGTLGPHDPYFVPREFLDLYDPADIQLPPSFSDRMEDKPALYRRTRDRFDQLPQGEQREAMRHYLAYCSYEDALFGRVLDALEQSGQAEDTLVVYLSDHGDYMADHGLWCKGLPCFKGAYHIPMAVRWPGRIAGPGRAEDALVTLCDWAPTFLEIAGVGGGSFTGRSLVPLLAGEKPQDWRDAHFTQTNGNELYGIQRSVTTQRWKFVCNGFDYDELYDLAADPEETVNRVNDPACADVIRDLSRRLWRFARETGDVCINSYIMVALAAHGPGAAFEDL